MSYLTTQEANYKLSPRGKDGAQYPYIMRKSGKAGGGGSEGKVERRALVTIARAQAREAKQKRVVKRD